MPTTQVPFRRWRNISELKEIQIIDVVVNRNISYAVFLTVVEKKSFSSNIFQVGSKYSNVKYKHCNVK